MTHRTRPAHLFLKLNLVALALLHVCAFAPQLRAWQDPMPTPLPPAQAPVAAPSSSDNFITKEQLLYALRSRQHEEAALVRLVERRRVSFQPTAEDEKELRAAGATDRLLEAVRKTYIPPRVYGGGTGAGVGAGERIGLGPARGGGTGGGGVDYSRPFRQTEVTRKAMITSKPEPGYTEEARKNFVEGVVRLRVVLNSSGKVTDISVVKGLPDGLTEKAVSAARQMKFTPAEKDGRKVSQYVFLEYTFGVPLTKSDVDEPAIILDQPAAGYTEEARRAGVRGKVVLRVTLTSYGRSIVEWVKTGLPHGLTEKAVEAAQLIRFEPARLGGRTVSQRVTVEYLFAP